MARSPKARQFPFVWEGVDSRGKKVSGELDAPGAAYIKAVLRRQGIKPGKIRRKAKPLFVIKKRITPKDITFATRQLSTMIAAGIPIAQSLNAIGTGHENGSVQDLLGKIRVDVEAGTNLSSAVSKYPMYFDQLFENLVAAGEQSGTLDRLLDKIATYLEKIEAIKSKIKAAMFYPAAIFVVAIVVVSLLMLFVIPQFESLFKNFGADLPTLTQMMVDSSDFFRDYWWAIFGSMIGSVVILSFLYKRSDKMQYVMDQVMLKFPIFGVVIKKATIARFSRTLATMFGAGVPLVDSLESVSGAAGNRVFQRAILDIRNQVSTGRPLEASMANTNLFPNMVLQMVATGEESGELELMLDKVADFYEREVDDAVQAMSSLIEPFMIVILGGLVGTIVVAMYLPIFKMAAVF